MRMPQPGRDSRTSLLWVGFVIGSVGILLGFVTFALALLVQGEPLLQPLALASGIVSFVGFALMAVAFFRQFTGSKRRR